jgi:DNA-binding HxlR family transcriptional regulator
VESPKVEHPEANPTITQTLKAISSESTLNIIKVLSCSSNKCDSFALMKALKLSKKQFYIAISHLSNQGIVKRTDGEYRLTSFGKVLLNSLSLVEDTINMYSKTQAIDAIKASHKITNEEILKLVNILIDNELVREIIKVRYFL